MDEDIRYMNLCGRLLAGNRIDGCYDDMVWADNILYKVFGMSSDDIMENLGQNVDNATIFY